MVSPPRMPKLNSEAVVRHFAALAEAVDIEIVVQDYPPISGYAMEPGLLARIAREIPRARTIKLEDPPTPFKTSRILDQAGDFEVRIFGGLGGVFLLEELMAGATGAMTGFAFPEILVKIVTLYRAGDVDGAADVFYRAVPLMRFEFQEGDRDGDSQGSAAPPRRAVDRSDARARRRSWTGPRARRWTGSWRGSRRRASRALPKVPRCQDCDKSLSERQGFSAILRP